MCFAQDDGSVVVGTDLALLAGMEERPLAADRVKMVEDKLGTKTLEEHFREQAELINRRFDESFRAQTELLDRRFDESFRAQAEQLDQRFMLVDQRFILVDQRFDRVDATLAGLRKDMAIVRGGVSILLTRDRT